MSMIFWVLGITQDQIAALRAAPTLASDITIIAQNNGQQLRREVMMKKLPPEKRAEAEARFQALETAPLFLDARAKLVQARKRLGSTGPVGPALDLEKSWHILHYVLTGDVGPTGLPGDALLTGEDLGEDITGYGPPRVHDPKATHDFADFLVRRDIEDLQVHINYHDMMRLGVYGIPMGQGSETEFEGELRNEITSNFPKLRDYVAMTAEKQNGLLMWLT